MKSEYENCQQPASYEAVVLDTVKLATPNKTIEKRIFDEIVSEIQKENFWTKLVGTREYLYVFITTARMKQMMKIENVETFDENKLKEVFIQSGSQKRLKSVGHKILQQIFKSVKEVEECHEMEGVLSTSLMMCTMCCCAIPGCIIYGLLRRKTGYGFIIVEDE